MIDSLITSKTRIKLLLRFFLNSETTGYLRSLETDFGESTNSIRVELNRFEHAGLLNSNYDGKKKVFYANTSHPLYSDINNMLKKMIGIDQIIDNILEHIGYLHSAYLTGSFAEGKDSKNIELALVGNNLDERYINDLVTKTETYIKRKIAYLILTQEELVRRYENKSILLIWKLN